MVIMKLCLRQFVFTSAGAFYSVRVGRAGQTDAETSFLSDLQVCFTLIKIGDAVYCM